MTTTRNRTNTRIMSRRSPHGAAGNQSTVETQGSVVGAVDVGTVEGAHVLGVGSCVKSASVEGFTSNAHTINNKATTMTMTDTTKARRVTFNAGDVDAPHAKTRHGAPDAQPQTKTEFVDRTSRAQLLMNRHIKAPIPLGSSAVEPCPAVFIPGESTPAPAGSCRELLAPKCKGDLCRFFRRRRFWNLFYYSTTNPGRGTGPG